MARLTGTVQYSLVRPHLTINGAGVHLDCRLPTGNCGLSATLDVPADTPVNLATGGGNMQASGIQRDVTLDSAGGDVTLSGIGGNTDLSTGGGNVNAGDLGGIMQSHHRRRRRHRQRPVLAARQAETGGGNVTLVFTKAPTYLDITSSGGDVSIVLPHGSTRYAITYDHRRRQLQRPGADQITSSPANTINVQSGGGNISIAES